MGCVAVKKNEPKIISTNESVTLSTASSKEKEKENE